MTVVLILTGLFVAFLTGVLAAFGSPVLLILFIGMIVGAVLIAKPRLAVWVVLIGGLVVSGLVELYLPGLQQIRWGVALLSMTLIAVSLGMAALTVHSVRKDKLDPAAKVVLAAAVGLIVSAMLTIVANSSSLGANAVGLKNYFQMFGLLAAFAVFRYTPEQASRFMRFILVLGLIQLPFVLHQFIELVPLRSSALAAAKGIVAVDIVAGTFGGSMMGGGRSATLALLAAVTIMIVLAQFKMGRSTRARTMIYCILFAIPMALNEAKLFILILPMGLFLLFKDRILKNPIKAFATSLLVGGLMVSFFSIYSMLPGSKDQHVSSVDKFLDNSIEYNFGDRGYGNAVLNRTRVYSFWWSENVLRGDYIRSILGHGTGATNSTSIVAGDTLANTRYRGYGIGLTGVSSLLWEVGVLGTFAVFYLLATGYRLGGKLADRFHKTSHWAYLKGAQLGVLFVMISLFHNNLIVFDIGYQALLMLFLGYLVAMSRVQNHSQTL